MAKYFNLKAVEEDIDYLLSVNELGNMDFIDDLMSISGNTTPKQIMSAFKTSIIVYFFYIKLANEEENYELSSKILRVVEFERMGCFNQLVNAKVPDDGLDEYLDVVVDEIKQTILDK